MKYLILITFLVLSLDCFALTVLNQQSKGTQASSSVLELLVPNGKRGKVIFHNYGPDTAILKYASSSATSTDGFAVGSGGQYIDSSPPGDNLYLKVPSSTVEYYIYEANEF